MLFSKQLQKLLKAQSSELKTFKKYDDCSFVKKLENIPLRIANARINRGLNQLQALN